MRRGNLLAGMIAAVATFVVLSAFVHRPHHWRHGWRQEWTHCRNSQHDSTDKQ